MSMKLSGILNVSLGAFPPLSFLSEVFKNSKGLLNPKESRLVPERELGNPTGLLAGPIFSASINDTQCGF